MSQSSKQLLRALKEEQGFFQSGGYGYTFRSQWRPTLLFRDAPICSNFSSAGELNPCQRCPLFSLVPIHRRKEAIPCHHIVLDSCGNTIAGLYRTASQEILDRRYCDWLAKIIEALEKARGAA
ncbi:MAG TPA: hypothetical protein VKU42_08825 [Candidatus Angelobacter sp.]|nr:hypothetical protein [Candidatus Angelobacter sp.]